MLLMERFRLRPRKSDIAYFFLHGLALRSREVTEAVLSRAIQDPVLTDPENLRRFKNVRIRVNMALRLISTVAFLAAHVKARKF